MKKLAFLFVSVSMLIACNNTTNQTEEETETMVSEINPDYQYYGDTINDVGAIPVADLMTKMEGTDSAAMKVEGVITGSCQKKGCWMKMDLGNGEQMHVSFKDYEFFVPKNLDGETAIMEGYAKVSTTDVDMLRHLAEDAGKSEEEIAAITEPEVGVTYVATGVIIKPKS